MIEIQDLYKYFGDRRAVGPLTATIQQGEIVGLLGLNGAGKTTTLRILACDLLPTSGSVRVGGLDVVEQPHEVRSTVGYLPDRPPLYDDMTVNEYLGYVARLRTVPKTDVARRVGDVEEMTELGEVRHQLIGTLSHGYRQRVGIAQAIVHRPAFVVLDEPIGGLDPVQIVEMRDLVRNLRGEHTVVVSSHILHEISETCDRILVIKDGEIRWQGSERDLSSQLSQSMRVQLTLRVAGLDAAAAEEKARAALGAVTAVQSIEAVPPAEAGDGVASVVVVAQSDVRDELCRALVGAGIGVLEVARQRELESMFLELVGEPIEGEKARRRRKKRRETERAADAAPSNGKAAS
ncbi:MAG TPA: ABC transporter ATP-binding protein [Polyangiaceae bacterium]|nr:ABC transporter ATP-binding protein [Polyangiaceae bacterium]